MAAHTSILLLAALCVGAAHSLQCYTCSYELSNSNCKTATNCSSGSGYCETALVTASAAGISVTAITKNCTETCTPSSSSIATASISTACCTSDLCNLSGAISIKSSYSAIFLVMGTILMFFSDSLL
ncbi:lymphocyte antigen 6E-like [Rana temporaria]|uniref:lymphocyte antigen 6E-like n=1 Tax=Rana temporaria TaxID=8407 RepID=UPI001AACD518|nr:lymphocyte antigen 6E-like [Rana temporaria]